MSVLHQFFAVRHRVDYSIGLKSFDFADRTGSGILDLVWSYASIEAKKSRSESVAVWTQFATLFREF